MLYTEVQKQEHIEEILNLLYQISLRDSRIPIVLPGKEYSDEAALTVRAYQQEYGLPVTGEIDDHTWNSISETYHNLIDAAEPLIVFPAGAFLLQERDSGELVQLVQVLLNLAAAHYGNLEPVTVNGIYDADSAAAVRKLQAVSSLPETGMLDRKTWNQLATLINSLSIGI